ncbi:DgyrCDS3337 [Dimorphilus gyrociliatus]|uniref:DgyrCDS3337 n=1 Tax=Dimorphilus gyrociliatus TaxID=2664684 RepID=A0A7I8VCX1_9ANNE|nr:DgyrCDS3337 [Dimorphilus gyrociliatus]
MANSRPLETQGLSSNNNVEQQQIAQLQHPAKMQFTKEELLTLKECNRESFWKRCVPFSIGLMTCTQYLINAGYLSKSPRFGSMMKLTAAGLIGYIGGKFSYQGKCREKILALENSPLADAMRKRGTGFMQQMSVPNSAANYPEPGSEKLKDEYSSNVSVDMDSNKKYAGLNDANRPTIEGDNIFQKQRLEPLQTETVTRSYDDLRKQNREDYAKKMASGWKSAEPATRKEEPSRERSG